MTKIKDVNQGDLLTFINGENKYKILLCTDVYKDRNPQNFTFCLLDYNKTEKPTLDDIKDLSFFGVGNMTKKNSYNYSEQELEKMWFLHPEIKPCLLGSCSLVIWRKDFMTFRDNLEFIGNLKILPSINKNGNCGINASGWDFLESFHGEKLQQFIDERGQKLFSLNAIIKAT
ncbi:hypothetical protein [Flavobacterium sp.]|uniref:hypothetical protein n=1 Tax=Flavobacterium sp. TaxID=239 RepID=UPI002ED9E4B1